MNARKIGGAVLLVLGILALAARGFSYTKENHQADLGPVKFSMKEKARVEVPVWVGVVLAAGGGALLLIPTRGRRD